MRDTDTGQGFQLPEPERTPATFAPIPELADGGDWLLVDSPHPLDSHAGLDLTGGGEMQIPLHVDTPAARLIRQHELGHARWTPRGMPPAMSGDFAMQLAEDARVWRRLASSGIDTSAAGMPPAEMRQRVSSPTAPVEYLLGLLVATAGTGDRDDMQQAVRDYYWPELAEDLIVKADAIIGRYMSDPWPTFADTIGAADCIRNNALPPDPDEGPGEGEPGEGEGSGEGSGSGEGEGSESDGAGAGSGEGDGADSDSPGEPGEGSGSGEGSGEGSEGPDSDSPGEGSGSDSPGEGSGSGSGRGKGRGKVRGKDSRTTGETFAGGSEGDGGWEHDAGDWRKPVAVAPLPTGWQPRPWEGPRPTGSKRAAITRHINAEAEARAKAKAAEVIAANLSPAERSAGKQTAKTLLTEVAPDYCWDRGELRAGDMTLVTVPLPHRLPARMRGTNYRATSYGGRVGQAARVNTDGALFRGKRSAIGGGTVLIDCSGSMSLDDSEVLAILQAAPAVTVATYAGSCNSGELRIIASKGRRADSDNFQPPYGGNIVDLPALEWLGQQPSRPRIWVSDGIVTGRDDKVGLSLFQQAAALCQRFGIHRVASVSELMTLTGKGRGR